MSEKPYDIQQRTFLLGLNIIQLSKHLPHNQAGKVLCNQLVRAGTSIGANMEEATAASSKTDFIYKCNISLREARETNYWLRLIKESEMISSPQINELITESQEIMRIIGAIVSKARGKRRK
ncbi:MAG: four helix bundle protein [Bacteroidetes bacterium]|nr:four helix bundle protein [Bacteroidota bacterium]